MESLGKSPGEGIVLQSLVLSLVVMMVMVMVVVLIIIIVLSYCGCLFTAFQEFARCNIVAWRLATSWAIQAV